MSDRQSYPVACSVVECLRVADEDECRRHDLRRFADVEDEVLRRDRIVGDAGDLIATRC